MAKVQKKAASKKKAATRKKASVAVSAPQELILADSHGFSDNIIEIAKYLGNLDEVDTDLKTLAHSIESRKKTIRPSELAANKELLSVLTKRAEINLDVIAKLGAANAKISADSTGASNVNVNLANINFEDPNAAARYYADILASGGTK